MQKLKQVWATYWAPISWKTQLANKSKERGQSCNG